MRVHHLALRCADVERTARFYTTALALVERERKHHDDGSLRAIWLAAEGVVVMCEPRAEREPAIDSKSLELVAFAVTRGELEAFRARLGAVEAESAYTLYARDPDGRRVAVSCYEFL